MKTLNKEYLDNPRKTVLSFVAILLTFVSMSENSYAAACSANGGVEEEVVFDNRPADLEGKECRVGETLRVQKKIKTTAYTANQHCDGTVELPPRAWVKYLNVTYFYECKPNFNPGRGNYSAVEDCWAMFEAGEVPDCEYTQCSLDDTASYSFYYYGKAVDPNYVTSCDPYYQLIFKIDSNGRPRKTNLFDVTSNNPRSSLIE